MIRKINTSQLRSKQKQLINKYNQAVRKHSQNVRRAVNTYNSEARKYNARVRANRQKIITELNKLKSRITIRYEALTTSTLSLNTSYQNLDAHEHEFASISHGNDFLDLSERENANSLAVSNSLENDEEPTIETIVDPYPELISDTKVTNELFQFSPELDDRWRGALFSLNPGNPDASRHFCTSAREIFITILDNFAPDEKVSSHFPICEKTEKGYPTRRWKIKYILENAGIVNEMAVDFVDENVNNILQLFKVFNKGTHGFSGKYDFKTLVAIKERVESSIFYFSKICNDFGT